MDINIITIHYHPFYFLKQTLENNYRIFKKEKIKFKHYLVDNKYPLEKEEQKKIKDLCKQYNIIYLSQEKNLGLVGGKNYFHHEVKPKDIIFHLESDVFLLTENVLSNIFKIEKNNDIPNIIYLNNKNLDDYKKEIYQINNVNVFKLDIKDINHTWIQCCFYNTNYQEKIQKILDNNGKNNYDFPGENNENFKKENIPFLIANDLYEDMEKYRFQNYFEYEYYKAMIYYWSKFEEEFKNLTFENFIDNYDYYFQMDDKFMACYMNLKSRSKEYIIKPNFYFKKTQVKFDKINFKNMLKKNRQSVKKTFKISI